MAGFSRNFKARSTLTPHLDLVEVYLYDSGGGEGRVGGGGGYFLELMYVLVFATRKVIVLVFLVVSGSAAFGFDGTLEYGLVFQGSFLICTHGKE